MFLSLILKTVFNEIKTRRAEQNLGPGQNFLKGIIKSWKSEVEQGKAGRWVSSIHRMELKNKYFYRLTKLLSQMESVAKGGKTGNWFIRKMLQGNLILCIFLRPLGCLWCNIKWCVWYWKEHLLFFRMLWQSVWQK